jgi:hypothetical protein
VDEITVDWAGVAAIATLLLAFATFWLAWSARRGIIENKKLIEATQRQTDLLWHSAIPHLIPEDATESRLTISYASGTIPARNVRAWVGLNGEVRSGSNYLLAPTGINPLAPTGNIVKVLDLAKSIAGNEPPAAWADWLTRNQAPVTYRVVMHWSGPGDRVTERAWRLYNGQWVDVAESERT